MYKYSLMILLIIANGHCAISYAQTNVTTDFIAIRCCDLLEILSDYMIHNKGDKLDKSLCVQNEDLCVSLKLVNQFMKHTSSVLNTKSRKTHNSLNVFVEPPYIKISQNTLHTNVAEVLVLAFLGRAVASDDGLVGEHLSLEYDSAEDKISVRDSACSMDKTIYSTIILASITLLIFFIAVQVVEAEKRQEARKEQLLKKVPVVYDNKELMKADFSHLLRMRTNTNF